MQKSTQRYYTTSEYLEIAQKAGTLINLMEWEPASAWINIFGSMLFPDDQNKRFSWIFRVFLCAKAASYQRLLSNGSLTPSESCSKIGQDFSFFAEYMEGPENLTSLLFGAQYNDIESEGKNRIENGMIVGGILLRALNSDSSLQEIAEHYHKEAVTISVSAKSILRNLWPQYLPMAHYWAAMVTFANHDGLNLREDITDPNDILYCQQFRDKNIPDGVIGLAKLAESYLFQGINKIPKRTGPRRPLLDISKMFFVLHPFSTFSALYAK